MTEMYDDRILRKLFTQYHIPFHAMAITHRVTQQGITMTFACHTSTGIRIRVWMMLLRCTMAREVQKQNVSFHFDIRYETPAEWIVCQLIE